MASTTTRAAQLSWLLDDLIRRVPSTQQAVVLSADGLPLGSTNGLPRDDAEHFSALAAGFASLSRGAGRHFKAGTVRQTIVEMDSAFLFVTTAGKGACLAVLADADSDIGVIAYEMAMLVTRVGQFLSAPERHTIDAHDAP
jgi:predicted regulator of Ras-like GTPase activity (Roadblock/LC7/MglB family)